MKPEIIYVDDAKLKELYDKCALQELADHKPIKNSVFVLGSEYVVTGMMGGGTGKGWREVYASRIVDLPFYKGSIMPLVYNSHWHEINLNIRERGYEGLSVAYGKRQVVLCEKVIFVKAKVQAVQASLF